MRKTSDEVSLHPRLWQIVDGETYSKLFEIKEEIEGHVEAVNQKLQEFYKMTGADEGFFEDSPAPNVSNQVYGNYLELRRQHRYQWPNYEFAEGYISLALKVNEMLGTREFDHCIKFFEKKLAELNSDREISQFKSAMADGISQLQLEKHSAFRGSENAPITDRDRRRIFKYTVEYLKDDYGWSEKDIHNALEGINL